MNEDLKKKIEKEIEGYEGISAASVKEQEARVEITLSKKPDCYGIVERVFLENGIEPDDQKVKIIKSVKN